MLYYKHTERGILINGIIRAAEDVFSPAAYIRSVFGNACTSFTLIDSRTIEFTVTEAGLETCQTSSNIDWRAA